jgi:hypothetical protein
MPQSGQACKSGERQQSATIIEFHPQPQDFAQLPHCIIRYNLSGVVNRSLIGSDRMKLATF